MSEREKRLDRLEIERAAQILGETFVVRRDWYARQLSDRYVAYHEPLTQSLLEAHLRGEITLGSYLLDADSQGRYMVLDADDEPDRRRLLALSRALAELDCPSYLERSRRGAHLWLFFESLHPSEEIRTFGKGLMHHFNLPAIELFPKQDRLRSGPGSLIRLPFGIHRRANRRYGFVTYDGEPLAKALREQLQLLSSPGIVPDPVWEQFMEVGRELTRKAQKRPDPLPQTTTFEADGRRSAAEIKAAITARQFILRFVELSPAGMGLCPFHDDHNPSFSVSDDENFWYCFACAEGGDIIDFWMKWRSCDFKTALLDLDRLLIPEPPAEVVEDDLAGL